MMSTFRLRPEYGTPTLLVLVVCGFVAAQATPCVFAEANDL